MGSLKTNNTSNNNNNSNELDGSTVVNECVKLAQIGSSYLSNANNDSSTTTSSSKMQEQTRASEPIRLAITALRHQLILLGFTDKTARAGIIEQRDTATNATGSSSRIKGGDVALVEEFVRFRSSVRKLALESVQSKPNSASNDDKTCAKEILKLCDNVRENALPAMGLEVVDIKQHASSSDWKWCVPKQKKRQQQDSKTDAIKPSPSSPPIHEIALEDMFRVGSYVDMFSKYDENGIPILNADGSEVSKSMLKKLNKKRNKHATRLDLARKNELK
mmetsp:Transcript_34970/g.51369  ORF Transcript_34970/g.51369 Transcript_34970/m.51369 type:complete len:276 (-) Transcript_34970:142-969(-)